MKFLRTLILALVAVLGLSACLQEEKVVKLKADGSGTIEETVVIGKEAINQLKQMSEGFGALVQKNDAGGFQVMDEEKLKKAADKMGDGVTFVSATPIKTENGEGYKAVYAFKNINKLKLDENPGESMPSASGAMKLAPKTKREPVTFQFTKGAPNSLTIKLPQPKDADLEKAKSKAPANVNEDTAATMMQQVFKDMKVALSVEMPTPIVDTNAEYREGQRVTLMELDFNKVLANPEKFKELARTQAKSIEETKLLIRGVDGIKAETKPTITVRFQ